MSYQQRIYQGPRKEREYRKQLRQQQEATAVVHFPTNKVVTQSRKEQKHSWLELGLHYLVILAAIGLAILLVGLEMYMGWNVAYQQASDPNNQLILGLFNVAAAAFTFLLPHIATRAKVAWIVWGLIFFPYSLYNTYTWIHQNWADVLTSTSEHKTQEVRDLETRYSTVSQEAYGECHTGKTGQQRGDRCTVKETEEKDIFNQLTAERKKAKLEHPLDPRNTAVVKLLSFVHVEASIETVKTVIALIVSCIPPSGGLVLMFALRSLKREE